MEASCLRLRGTTRADLATASLLGAHGQMEGQTLRLRTVDTVDCLHLRVGVSGLRRRCFSAPRIPA